MPEAHQFRIVRKPQGLIIFFTFEHIPREGSYHIYPLSSLGACVPGSQRSEWVRQVAEKAWATLPMLYQLAVHIQQLQPQNPIDWVETFVPIEKAYNLARQFEHHSVITHSQEARLNFGAHQPESTLR